MFRDHETHSADPTGQTHSGRALLGLALSAVLAIALIHPANASPQATTTSRGSGPDRSVMAWSRALEDFSAIRIVVGRPDGGPVRELTDSVNGVEDIDPKFSPDGSRILFERDLPDGDVQIMVVNVDGTGERVLPLGCVDPCVADVGPTWAPDGRHVYFTRVMSPFDDEDNAASAVLHRSTLDGRRLTRISPPGIDSVYEDYGASFAPAGYMVFIRYRNADGKTAAFRHDRGGRLTQLTPYALDADTLSVSPAASGPSKDLIVFETFGHGAPDGTASAVATVPSTCRSVVACAPHVRYLTSPESLPLQHFNPTWSPDGREIAYVRFSYVEPGPATGDIWRMTWNGKDKRPVSASPRFEFRPAWGTAKGAGR